MSVIKAFLFGNKVPLPEEVKKRMKEFHQNGELIDHFCCKIRMNGTDYFEITFSDSKDPSEVAKLIVRADGTIPPVKEICHDNFEDVVWVSTSIDCSGSFIEKKGKKWSKYPANPYKRVIKLLSRINNIHRNEIPEEIQEAWKSFNQVAKGYINKQNTIRDSYEKGKIINERLFKTHIATLEDCNELDFYHTIMVRSAYDQNDMQLKTYEDRKKLLQYLFSHTKWFQIGCWIIIFELFYHHSRLLNEKKLTEEDRVAIKKTREILMNDNSRLYDGDFYRDIRSALRNPKGSEESK
ncbi:hypothetical protein [Mechercharimyces sp. CAU 1602]|uniref:hypothetical protein n=1 Tax=Mechercharimyces sp. CAU 1602 TaxID=2973933 RepID=UPI002163F21A|nr:hypothetical protein [Mechercharimyces sp. CAU 1602]MCS1350887.1 hypothetical protein [Mechercharimyces sp. CAU 1602]